MHTSSDIKVKMAYFFRCNRDIKLGISKIYFAASPISMNSNIIMAPPVRGGKEHTIRPRERRLHPVVFSQLVSTAAAGLYHFRTSCRNDITPF